jgi:hypothetical protein
MSLVRREIPSIRESFESRNTALIIFVRKDHVLPRRWRPLYHLRLDFSKPLALHQIEIVLLLKIQPEFSRIPEIAAEPQMPYRQ